MSNSNSADNYNNVNDFLNDAGFINFHFKLNARDEAWWQNWIERHPKQTAIINEARGILNMLSFSIPEDEYNTELEKIKFAISKGAQAKQNKSIFRLPIGSRTRKIAVAATILVLIISGIFLVSYFTPTKELTEHFNNTTGNLAVKLDDNTNVLLSPGSRLTYHAFSSAQRDVTLQGNGNFVVTKNKNVPFRVFTGKIVAIVLGTTFDIKSNSDSSIIVALREGSLKVGVLSNGTISQELLLKPDQSAVFNNRRLVMLEKTVATDAVKNNERHDVEFSRNDFLQIAEIISNVYGVTLVNESGTNNWKFSGQFKNSTALEIIESICLVKGLTSSAKGDTIVIR
jgi:ferric-dicitrate binding protein FerR (iron transport regulator)